MQNVTVFIKAVCITTQLWIDMFQKSIFFLQLTDLSNNNNILLIHCTHLIEKDMNSYIRAVGYKYIGSIQYN